MLPDVADLTDVLATIKADGHDFTPEQVARLGPYMTTHLKRFGQYVLDTGANLLYLSRNRWIWSTKRPHYVDIPHVSRKYPYWGRA